MVDSFSKGFWTNPVRDRTNFHGFGRFVLRSGHWLFSRILIISTLGQFFIWIWTILLVWIGSFKWTGTVYKNFGFGFSKGLEWLGFWDTVILLSLSSTLIAIQSNNTTVICQIEHLMKARSLFSSING